MSATTKHEKLSAGDSPVCGKSRGNRLARRARSFKEDFLEIISQMRSPSGSATRSGSPCSPKHRAKGSDLIDGNLEKNPSKDLECNVRQAQSALKHFRDVISKNKLEMLPGNGTVVLETVTAIHVLLKKYVLNEQSSTLVSATNQVYQSVAKLIKLCDDYLLIGDKALNKENVTEVVNQVEDAIQNLVSLTKDKLAVKDSNYKLSTDGLTNHVHKPRTLTDKGSLDLVQRSSLPDIPLTPREREILEQTSAFVLERHSQSTENVLRDSPPPKPPHPDRAHLESPFPPPLPPKKRQKQLEELCGVKNSIECLSLRSKSPEDSSSLLSASGGSLDSVLNHSREEEEMRVLIDQLDENDRLDDHVPHHFHHNGSSQSCCWDSSSSASTEHMRLVNSSALSDSRRDSPVFSSDITVPDNAVAKLERLSGSQAESGFCSIPSRRSSCQSYSTSSQQLSSTRSSQLSYTSQEFHHTERKFLTSTDTTNSHKYQSSYVDGNQNQSHKVVSNSVSSEKLSYQKKTYYKKYSEMSSNEFWSVDGSPCKRLQDIPCCHNEIKIHECQLHAACVSSPPGSMKNSPKQLSPVHGNLSPSQEDDTPPALPEKTRSKGGKRERHPSQYDNVTEGNVIETTHEKSCVMSHSQTVMEDGVINHKQTNLALQNSSRVENIGNVTNFIQADRVDGVVLQSRTADGITEGTARRMGCSVIESGSIQTPDGKPPPLPPKKKHIMAYMEMFGNASHANTNEFLRHSVHTYNLHQSEWQQHEKMLTSTQSCSFILNSHSDHSTPIKMLESKSKPPALPPALPPKKSRTLSATSSPPSSPINSSSEESKKIEIQNEVPLKTELVIIEDVKPEPVTNYNNVITAPEVLPVEAERSPEISLLDKLEVTQYLLFKKNEDEGPDIRGGHPDALVIYATKAHKNDFLYQEAFLTTYRTFMTPLELIQKLCYRHDRFINSQDTLKQRAARESFSLLVRVVSDLTLSDLDQVVLQSLMEFVQQLLCRGDLTMAKALRVILLTKYAAKKEYMSMNTLLPSHNIYTRQSVLLDFKSEQIAEQMTLLDAELFFKIEIPEVLIWAQEQNEEKSPNLTKFTEHFNKMSYWARSRILEQNDAKDRERYVVKFIKIMKHLRKINNFNSYLALLSALDSAPIRRLEWQKHITEGLKEYCALIDSSSSFRAYRQALAETQPPCIPYIGLVLQDLTFVHIGNTNVLPDGGINFSKRWQQFNIVENMKRFKKGSYPYKKNERIIAFFNGFDESLSEEAMWQISEKIKPRGGKKA